MAPLRVETCSSVIIVMNCISLSAFIGWRIGRGNLRISKNAKSSRNFFVTLNIK